MPRRRCHRLPSTIIAVLLVAAPAAPAAQPGSGPRKYVDYPGTATIVAVERAPDDDPQGRGAAEAGYVVRFAFKPKQPVKEELGRAWLARHREQEFLLSNGWRPGGEYLKKYGITKGRALPATMHVIVMGTSTPVLFDLDGVDATDFFEAAPDAAPNHAK